MLKESRIEEHYIYILTEALDEYKLAFTAPSIDPENNYEMYEILGDSTANESLVWYFYETFPQLHCPSGVKIIARLKINNSGTESFSAFATSLNFLPYINATPEELTDPDKQAKLLEDVFEALIGAIYIDLGILHVKQFIMKTVLSQPLDLEDDNYKDIIMRWCQSQKYDLPIYTVRSFENQQFTIDMIICGQYVSFGCGTTKKQAEQDAAEKIVRSWNLDM
jgi:ribonuclease-3